MDSDSDNETVRTVETTTKSTKLAIQGVTLDVTSVSHNVIKVRTSSIHTIQLKNTHLTVP